MIDTVPFDILKDDLTGYDRQHPAFVSFGETMIRDTPADNERIERTRQVWVSLGGSELTVAVMLSRLGIPSTYITRIPDNPFGWMLRDIAQGQGVNTDHLVWAEKNELMGRYLYELGRTPRAGIAWYQRKYSAASKLGTGMVDWENALKDARLFHTSGITFGLSTHSGYDRNYLLEAYHEALAARPGGCLVGMDFNYRSTLWSIEQCRQVMTPILKEKVDILVTTLGDMAQFYGLSCGNVTAETIGRDEFIRVEDADLHDFMQRLIEMFDIKVVALTFRYPDSHEQHRWESAAMDNQGHFHRSTSLWPIVLWDRLGGGDAWTGGFYYGLLTEEDPAKALQKGILVGDAATRLKQTLMYDLPILSRQEVQALMRADVLGGGKQTVR